LKLVYKGIIKNSLCNLKDDTNIMKIKNITKKIQYNNNNKIQKPQKEYKE